MKAVRYTPWWVNALVGVAFAVLLAGALSFLYALFGKMSDQGRASLYLEIAKALLQLIGVLILGTLVTILIKQLEKNRRADRALHDFRVEYLSRLRSLDESVKKARYLLRASGLTSQYIALVVVSPIQIEAYDEQMLALQDADSGVDRLMQDVENFREAFSSSVVLENHLRRMKIFLNNLLVEYEKHRPAISNVPFGQLSALRGFTDLPSSGEYKDWLAGYVAAVFLIRKDLLPFEKTIKE